MGTLHGIELCSACSEHEAQHAGKCRWCYDNDLHRKKKTNKVSMAEENAVLALVEDVVEKIPARSFTKGLK